MTRALGIDLSAGDGTWDAAKAKSAGISFMYTKATQQTVDSTYYRNMQAAKDNGILRGAFHYFDFRVNELVQAKLFCDTIKADKGELPPCIDYEQIPTGLTKDAAQGKLWNMVCAVEAQLGVKPLIYTGYYHWADWGSTATGWTKYTLWLAWWAAESVVKVPPPWTKWTFWQTIGNAHGPDYGCQALGIDLDLFNGTVDELLAFANVSHPPTVLTLEERVRRLEVMHNL
jgi:lysozyme